MNTKRLTLIMTLLTSVSLLGSCSSKKYGLYFSKLYSGDSILDEAITLSTMNDKESLDGLIFNIYRRQSKIYSHTFTNESVSKEKPFTFMNEHFTLESKIDNGLKLDSDYIVNSYYFELTDSKGNIIDALNTKGSNFQITNKQSLVRLQDKIRPSLKYEPLDYINVSNIENEYYYDYQYNLTSADILDGPRLDESLFGDKKFFNYETSSTEGGYTPVTFTEKDLGDGDTTTFWYPDEYKSFSGYNSRVRYLYINTPEIYHGPGSSIVPQPFGEEAKSYNNDKLRGSSVLVQSEKDGSIRDTYSRTLALVWYTKIKNPSISDYRLLNFELVKAGLAKANTTDSSLDMLSNHVTYGSYVKYAYECARLQGIKIHGEIDPNFDYSK